MGENTQPRGIIERQSLSREAGDQTAENISHSRRRHTRITRSTQVKPFTLSGPGGDEGPGSLQHDRAAKPLAQFPNRAKSILLNSIVLQQVARLTGMRSQYPVVTGLAGERHQVESVGIKYHGQFLLPRYLDRQVVNRGRPGGPAQPRTKHHNGGTGQQRHQFSRLIDAPYHEFRLTREDCADVCRMGSDAGHAGAGTKRGLSAHTNGATHAVVPANHQDMAKQVLVCIAWPRRQQRKTLCKTERAHRSSHIADGSDTQGIENHFTRTIRTVVGKKTPFTPDESHSDICANSSTKARTRVRTEPRRQINGKYRARKIIDPADQRLIILAHIAANAGTEQRIHDQLSLIQIEGGGINHLRRSRSTEIQRRGRVRPQFVDIAHNDHAHGTTTFRQHAANDVSVTGIVATAAADHDIACFRPTGHDFFDTGCRRASHQRQSGNPEHLNRMAVKRTDIVSGIQITGGFILHGEIIRELYATPMSSDFYQQLTKDVQTRALKLGFQQIGITDVELDRHEQYLDQWLKAGRQGEMGYMARHGTKRSRPAELIEGTQRVITARMNYLPAEPALQDRLSEPDQAYVSRYALGRDYHKVIRGRLAVLWRYIETRLDEAGIDGHTGRVFTDSAPVLEKALAEKSGLGWIGKNTLLLSRNAGSWFFLGEIYTSVPLIETTTAPINHCGSCDACIRVCPTDAIVAPYELDARRCISYLTIEKRGEIPLELRRPMGNRIFGCDDCQLYCPWNKYAQHSTERDFSPRHSLDTATLLALFSWTEEEFLKKTEGSAIRRTGYQGWLRNIAVALGNGPPETAVFQALEEKQKTADTLVGEHIRWAIEELTRRSRLVN